MMRWTMVFVATVVGFSAAAQGGDILNDAARTALEQARDSMAGSEKAAGVARVAVAGLEGDNINATALARSILTTTDFDVVLTDDADWAPLLDEFARQAKRQDLILEETAHQLRVQGVDAVVYGTVEKASVENVQESGREGRRATVRLMLNLASLSKENPGSLLWSEQVEGTADDLQPMTADQKVVSFFSRNRIVGAVIAGVVVLMLLAWFARRMSTPR